MAVQLPVMAIAAAMKVVQYQVEAQRDGSQSLRHSELVDLERQRLEAQDLKHERQSSVLIELANISQETTRMRLDMLSVIFSGVKDLLMSQQDILGREKATLTDAMIAPGTGSQQQALIIRRQREIDAELNGIREAMSEIAQTAMKIVQHLRPELQHNTITALENISDDLTR